MPKPEHQKHQGRIIRDEIRTSVSPQQAWEVWAEPEKIAGWFVDRATGKAEAGAAITWYFDSFKLALPYKVLEAVPGERFSVLWEGPMPPPGILEVIIERDGAETLIRLVQAGFREGAEWNEEYEGVASGWRLALASLREYLEHYFDERRTTLLLTRPARFSYAEVSRYYRDPSLLAQWLTNEPSGRGGSAGSIGDAGEECDLDLRGVGKLTGRVLARTEREVALSWPEERGVLELKAFSIGPQKLLCLRASLWGGAPEKAKQIEAQPTAAIDRLAGLLQKSANGGVAAKEDYGLVR